MSNLVKYKKVFKIRKIVIYELIFFINNIFYGWKKIKFMLNWRLFLDQKINS